jgi:hypothetical protein
MNRQIVYILSTDFAGSHFLSLMLGSHSQAMHLGEVKHLNRAGVRMRWVCYVCENKGDCEIMHGIGPGNIDQIYDIIFSRLAPGKTTLIDASKQIFGWADRFVGRQDYERKYIHLIRDPRALVRRWAMNSNYKRWIKRRRYVARRWPLAALAGSYDVYAHLWLAYNLDISEFIAKHDVPSILVTYEDLALHTEREVSRLCDFIGLPYEPAQLDYWNFQHHGTQKKDYAGKHERTFDLRWKEFLKSHEVERILGNQRVNDYLTARGLEFNENGITLSPAAKPPRRAPSLETVPHRPRLPRFAVAGLAALAGIVLLFGLNTIRHHKHLRTARAHIGKLKQGVEQLARDCGPPPATHGLMALVENPGCDSWKGPYLDPPQIPADPWGNPYRYRLDGTNILVESAGPDHHFDTSDDI